MSTKTINLNATRGDDFLRSFTLSGEWQANDIASMAFTIRSDKPESSIVDDDDDAVVAQVTFTETDIGQIYFDSAESQQGHVRVNKATTTGFTQDRSYYYDLRILTNSGIEHTPVKGKIIFGWDATRAPG